MVRNKELALLKWRRVGFLEGGGGTLARRQLLTYRLREDNVGELGRLENQ